MPVGLTYSVADNEFTYTNDGSTTEAGTFDVAFVNSDTDEVFNYFSITSTLSAVDCTLVSVVDEWLWDSTDEIPFGVPTYTYNEFQDGYFFGYDSSLLAVSSIPLPVYRPQAEVDTGDISFCGGSEFTIEVASTECSHDYCDEHGSWHKVTNNPTGINYLYLDWEAAWDYIVLVNPSIDYTWAEVIGDGDGDTDWGTGVTVTITQTHAESG